MCGRAGRGVHSARAGHRFHRYPGRRTPRIRTAGPRPATQGAHAFTTAPDGPSIIDADQVIAEVEQILDAVTSHSKLGSRIAGVAMDTFAASLVAVDATGRALIRA
jgi:hypothetical protein